MDTIFVFDPKGKFVRSFGKDWHGGGHGIEIRKEGNEEFIYLSNTWTPTKKLVKTNLKGEVVWVKGRPECHGRTTKTRKRRVQPDQHLLAARTAGSTSATATARTTCSTTTRTASS